MLAHVVDQHQGMIAPMSLGILCSSARFRGRAPKTIVLSADRPALHINPRGPPRIYWFLEIRLGTLVSSEATRRVDCLLSLWVLIRGKLKGGGGAARSVLNGLVFLRDHLELQLPVDDSDVRSSGVDAPHC